MNEIKVLWVDDEIDLLKPHILFLEQRNYMVTPVRSGTEAINAIENTAFDIVFLDENMPGLSGLETLQEIKEMLLKNNQKVLLNCEHTNESFVYCLIRMFGNNI